MPQTGYFQTCQTGTPVLDGYSNDVVLRTAQSNQRLFLANGCNVTSTLAIQSSAVTVNAPSFLCSNAIASNVTCTVLTTSNMTTSGVSTSSIVCASNVSQNVTCSNAWLSNLNCVNASIQTVAMSNISASNAVFQSNVTSNTISGTATIGTLFCSNTTIGSLTSPIINAASLISASNVMITNGSNFLSFAPGSNSVSTSSGSFAVNALLSMAQGAIVPSGQTLGIGTNSAAYPLDVRNTMWANAVISPSFTGSNASFSQVVTPVIQTSNLVVSASNIQLGSAVTVSTNNVAVVKPISCTTLTAASNVTVASLSIGTAALSNSTDINAISVSGNFAVTGTSGRLRANPSITSGNVALWSDTGNLIVGPPNTPALVVGSNGSLSFGSMLAVPQNTALQFGPHQITGSSTQLSLTTATSTNSIAFGSTSQQWYTTSLNPAQRGGCIQFANSDVGGRCILWQDGSDLAAYGGLGKEPNCLVLRTPPSMNITFVGGNGTAGTEYARFTSQGLFGVNTNAPQGRMHVTSPIDENVLVVANTGATTQYSSCILVEQTTSRSSTTAPIEFRVNGTVVGSIGHDTVSSTSYNTVSDYRVKNVIGPVENACEVISKLKPCKFAYKQDDAQREHWGFLAHELAEHIPTAVVGVKDGDALQQVDYSRMVPYLIAAVQEIIQKSK